MSLKDLHIEKEYRNLQCDIVNDFYVPVLRQACLYKRAVGFFNSAALHEISTGLYGLVQNDGKIQLIVSPQLTEEDVESIRLGYKKREQIIEAALLRSFEKPRNSIELNHYNLLANLIADETLDIKVAFKVDGDDIGIFHEKLGIMFDKDTNGIAFSGSMNETYSGMLKNYEAIDVFCSWLDEDSDRFQKKDFAFDRLWNNLEAEMEVIPFPNVAIERLNQYKVKSNDELIKEASIEIKEVEHSFFTIPKDFSFYDYQKEAIHNWLNKNARGIFDMATGTGKTYTALGAITYLSKQLKERLAVIIVCPYQHLVEQWVEDIELFGVKPIIAYSSYNNWKTLFTDAINAYRVGAINNFCLITTNATFESDDFQSRLRKIKKNVCFVVDEAHNIGATKISQKLPLNCEYRLALSATIERFRDDIGTEAILNYFGEKCIEYSLDRAIEEGFLTKYYYYPVVVNLTEGELDEYRKISKRIAKLGGASQENCEKNPTIELLLLKRARIVAGAQNKITSLLNVIEPFKSEQHILVYCGATRYDRLDIDDSTDIRQIDVICRELSNKLQMKVRKFTSEENKQQRERIRHDFINGDDLQVIAAIKCLDEGVNIPAIQKAFILASSTNPKEYIQRRGRVLRKFEGKDYAVIFDFITIPRPLHEVEPLDSEEARIELSLVSKEFKRMDNFGFSAMNPFEADKLREEILKKYGVYNLNEEDIIYG